MLASARDHYKLQQRITTRGVREAQKAARRGPSAVAAVVAMYQLAAARAGAASVPTMLAEQGIQDPAVGAIATTALAGVTSAGFPLEEYFSVVGNTAGLALAVATQLQDAGRNGASVAVAARTRVGYVRMLNPPSCSRCAVLAGKWFKWNQGFERHPKCDCRHVPTTEDRADDLRTHPDQYFDSLTRDQQDKIFTINGAQAIRDGADIGQVVNARRGMRTAQLYGRDAVVTSEGATKSGIYGRSQGADLGYVATRTGRYGYIKNQTQRRAKRARIMPETIYQIADDREDAQRLLALYGYILP